MSALIRYIGGWFKLGKQQDRAILQWLHEHPGWRYNLDISAGAGLPDGTIYPALARLFHQGWIERQWNKDVTPHRRMYRVKPR
jgi:DNA-binding IclR family transcriptional regulator